MVIWGIMQSQGDRHKENILYQEHRSKSSAAPNIQQPPENFPDKFTAMQQHTTTAAQPQYSQPQYSRPQYVESQYTQTQEPPKFQAPPENTETMPRVSVKISSNNPVLIEKTASLYHDSNRRNIYSGEEPEFKLQDIAGIRRFGRGYLRYDGFGFQFEHTSGMQKYMLNDLEHIAFYPNCVVLMPKNTQPAALLFVDETESIRKVLETFRVDSAV